jgi:plasmid stabilization system protein ParE
MAKRIVWASQARIDRYNILTYWKERNKSNSYSKILNTQFNDAVRSITKFPLMSKSTGSENVRVKIITHYHLIYEIFQNEIVILRLWDSRQNPQNLKY